MRKKQEQEENLQNQFNDFKEDDIRILKKKSINLKILNI